MEVAKRASPRGLLPDAARPGTVVETQECNVGHPSGNEERPFGSAGLPFGSDKHPPANETPFVVENPNGSENPIGIENVPRAGETPGYAAENTRHADETNFVIEKDFPSLVLNS